MNGPTAHAPPTMKAVAEVITLDGNLIAYTFPVNNGTPVERVTSDVRAILIRDNNLDIGSLQVFYPRGVWTEPLDRDRPPLGNGPEGPQHQPEAPEPQPRRIVPPQGGSGTAPPQRPQTGPQVQPGPLPQVPAQEGMGAAAMQLEAFLAQWRVQHNLTSAQFLAITLHATGAFALKLASLERPQPQRRPS